MLRTSPTAPPRSERAATLPICDTCRLAAMSLKHRRHDMVPFRTQRRHCCSRSRSPRLAPPSMKRMALRSLPLLPGEMAVSCNFSALCRWRGRAAVGRFAIVDCDFRNAVSSSMADADTLACRRREVLSMTAGPRFGALRPAHHGIRHRRSDDTVPPVPALG